MRNAARNLSSFLGAVGSIVKFIFAIIPSGPDPVMEALREGFLEINTKLDRLQDGITQLRTFIDWKSRETRLENYASKINAISEKLLLLEKIAANISVLSNIRTPTPAESEQLQNLTNHVYPYEINYVLNDYCRPPNFVDHHEIASVMSDENLFSSHAYYYSNDRRKVLNMTQIAMYYLAQASQVHISCLLLNNTHDAVIAHRKWQWEQIFIDFERVVREVDDDVKESWHDQARYLDIPKWFRDYRGINNADCVKRLEDELSAKYYWRNWVVAALPKDSIFFIRTDGNRRVIWHWAPTDYGPETNILVMSVLEFSLDDIGYIFNLSVTSDDTVVEMSEIDVENLFGCLEN